MNRKALALTAPVALMLVCVGCGSDEQLTRVEQEVGDLKVEVFKLRQQVEDQNKKLDSQAQAQDQARSEDQRYRADLQETLRQVQYSVRAAGNRAASAVATDSKPAGAAAAPASDEDRAYNAALLDYNRGNYPLAFDGLGLFLKSYPQSAHKVDALFFQGLCLYNQKTYDKAQALFEQIIREQPSSNQFLPSKLKRAQCLERLGLKPAAIKAFKELASGFPGTAEARTAQQELSDLGL